MSTLELPIIGPVRFSVTWRRAGTLAAAVIAVILVFGELLPHILHPDESLNGRWENPFPIMVEGFIQGMSYGLLGVGLVLIYRSNRIINFAHGALGAFGVALFGLLVVRFHVPYWVAMLPALAGTAGTGALAEAVVIRRLRKAPPIMSVVATLAVGTFLVTLGSAINSQASAGNLIPSPPGFPSFRVGRQLITSSYTGSLILTPIVVALVALFLKYSKYGLAMRGAAANPEAARMAGVFSGRMSGLAWSLAATLAAFGAILTAPNNGTTSADSFGPSLLLRALVAAVVARMSSLPVALATGCGIGVFESLVSANYHDSSVTEIVLFFVIVFALLAQKQRVGRSEEKGSWAAVQAARPLPAQLRQVWLIRNMGSLIGVVMLAVFAVLPLAVNNSNSVQLTGIFAFVIVGLSVGIVTGLGGQLSLGQFAIAAIGAVASYQVAKRTGNFVESFFYAGLASAAVSVLIGIPALRVKGLLLTVTTLAFSLVVPDYLLTKGWAFGASGVSPGQPIAFGKSLVTGHEYYYVGLVSLLLMALLARNIRNGGIGRLLVAVRDNEDAARAFTVPAARVKIQGFALAGFIAGVGGAMYGHSLSTESSTSFPTNVSITIVVMTVIGGVGLLSGPMLGSLIVLFIPDFVSLGTAGLAFAAFANLFIIMYLPGGLAQFATPLRDQTAAFIGRRLGIDVKAAFLEESSSGAAQLAPREREPRRAVSIQERPAQTQPRHVRLPDGEPLLEAVGIKKSFGGVKAVRGVSFGVNEGETLGLIGPNGAGKTTTFELLAGFTKVDEGAVRFAGHDVSYLGPEARGRLGLIRSFQDAALFPTMTVTECVQLSLERIDPTRFVQAVSGLTRQEKRKERAARDLVAWMGLDRYRSAQIQELSTGTRRITEVACLVALEPRMLLLDEPSSGVAQKETEALGTLLVRLKEQLDLTLVIIEHDIPLIMGLSDRIVAMADGEVIAAGTPEAVRHDPRVVEAYLGGSITAIERSGATPDEPPQGDDIEGDGPATETRSHREAGALSAPDEFTLAASTALAPDSRRGVGALTGLPSGRASALLSAFGSLEAIRRATDAELCAVPGIGPGTAKRVRKALRQEAMA